MRARDINIQQFKTIEELYSFIDENIFILNVRGDLANLWVNYRNHTKIVEEKQKAQWEIDCFLFDFIGHRLFPLSYSEGNTPNEIKQYPDLNEFQLSTIEYIKRRSIASKSSILIARYNHLLWKSPKGIKNRQYGLIAIENYLAAIKEYCNLFEKNKNEDIASIIGKLFETLVAACNEIKPDLGNVKALTKFLLFEIKGFEFYTKHGILRDMLENHKLFKPDDFVGTLSLFEEQLKIQRNEVDDFLWVNFYLPDAIKVAIRTGNDVRKWHDETGLAYLRLAKRETEDNRFWIKQDFHAKAISAFTLSGNTIKRQDAEQFYAELKPKVKLPIVRIDYDEKIQKRLLDFQEYIKSLSGSILKKSPFDIYNIISTGYFFPNKSNLLNAKKNKGNAFVDFATTIKFDNNKNISRQIKVDGLETEVLDIYNYHINMSVLPYLHYILIPGIKSEHLTFENFILFLVEKSWIGKIHIKHDLGGQEKPINWIPILTPSIVEFFVQIQAWLNSKYYKPSFILCLDSLTLKIEGLFRNFCERAKIPTSVAGKKGIQEVYIHNVLENEVIEKYFSEDDRLFFAYLFTSDHGLNLRNNVAHCYYDYQDYNLDKMLLIIACLLRLAKYNYKESDET